MRDDRRSRRWILRTGALAGAAGLAGCMGGVLDGNGGDDGGNGGDDTPGSRGGLSMDDFRGSGAYPSGRDIDAPSIADLPELSGTLSVYIGGGESGLYLDLVDLLEQEYPDFTVDHRTAPAAQHANTIIEERAGGSSNADVFWSVDAGALGVVADDGGTLELSADVVDSVPDQYHPNDDWVGVAGRARSIPYNPEQFSRSDVPNTVMDLPERDDFRDGLGWAPTYGAFQSFVTAMRLLEGPERTKQWLQDMVDHGVVEYNNEFFVSNAVADGEIGAGFANHYYALRVRRAREGDPIELAFTSGDAGALINVAGAAVVEGTDNRELAELFVRHLLSAEAQEFFATRTYAYPMVSGVPPVGGLPSIEELNPPEIDLSELSDLEPTLELMREVGVLG